MDVEEQSGGRITSINIQHGTWDLAECTPVPAAVQPLAFHFSCVVMSQKARACFGSGKTFQLHGSARGTKVKIRENSIKCKWPFWEVEKRYNLTPSIVPCYDDANVPPAQSTSCLFLSNAFMNAGVRDPIKVGLSQVAVVWPQVLLLCTLSGDGYYSAPIPPPSKLMLGVL
eukprot:1159273-Pelagomonas_calceolata.AAC.11